jgi:hypothetical protein
MTIVDYIEQKSATEFLNPTKNKQIVLLPTNLINLLDTTKIFGRIINEFIINHIILFIIILFFLDLIFQHFFYDIRFRYAPHIFLISIIPSIYNYLNGLSSWNDFIIGNTIVTITSYLLNIKLYKYINYYIIQVLIILTASILMLLFNCFSVPALVYGLIGITLIKQLGIDYLKYIIYIVLGFIIVRSVVFINNQIIMFVQPLIKSNKSLSF